MARARPRDRTRRALLVYAAGAVATLLIVSVVAVLLSGRIAERDALFDAERTAERLGTLVIGPLLGAALNGDPQGRAELDSVVDNRLSDGSISDLTIWDRDGVIVYADDPAVIGAQRPPTPELLAAIDRGVTTSGVEDRPETSGVATPGKRFVEVYTALELPGRAPLAFEVYLSYERVEAAAARLRSQIVPLALGALLLLLLMQVPITLSLARRVSGYESDRAALLERALSASERERRQIAADLHDGIVQDLAGAGYALSALARALPPERSGMAERVAGVVRDAVESLRRLMVDIYPPDLAGPGLAAAIDDLADPLRRDGVAVEVAAGPLPDLDPEIAAVIYRVAKEALVNVAKHADAGAVRIELCADDDPAWAGGPGVRLRVVDDGRGVPPDALARRADGHLGLRLLADRLADVGGELTLVPGEPTGTVAQARTPPRVGVLA